MSVLFCDTNCELWYDKAEELGLRVIRMPYIVDNEEFFYDLGKETDFKAFYKKMRSGKPTSTAALNEYDYTEYFEPVFASGEDIFYITFSHKMSATFESMDKAVEQLKAKYPDRKFTMFNTKAVSMGAGLQVYEAAKLWKKGATDEELLEFLEGFCQRVNTYFCVDSLRHLLRGGRISGTVYVMGSLLGLKPLIRLEEDGSLKNIGRVKGMKKVVSELAEKVKEKGEDLDKYDVWLIHGDCEEYAKSLASKIKELCGNNINVHLQIVGPVVATHCGAGTLGVIFTGKNRN